MSAELMTEIKEEVMVYLTDLVEGRLAIDSIVEIIARWKESPNQREQEMVRWTIRALSSHYKHILTYPLKKVKTVAVLFGLFLKHEIFTGDKLSIVAKIILTGLHEPPESNAFVFGSKALELFTEQLRYHPFYRNSVVMIDQFCDKRKNLVAFLEAMPPLKANFQNMSDTAAALARGGSLYVDNFDCNLRDSRLFCLFCHVGRVVSARVCRDPITRCNLGYGYVKYGNPQEAANAIEKLNLTQMDSNIIRVMCSSFRNKSGTRRVFFKNADELIDERGLHDIFWSFGDIESLEVHTHPSDGVSKGFGFVNFENADDAAKAVEVLNGMKIGDKKLCVELAYQWKEKRERASVQAQMSSQMILPWMAPPLYVYNNPPGIIGGQQLVYSGQYPPMLNFPLRPPPPRTIGYYGYQQQRRQEQQNHQQLVPAMLPGGVPSMHHGAAPIPPPLYVYNYPPSIIGGQQLVYSGQYPPVLNFHLRPPPPRTIGYYGYQQQRQQEQQDHQQLVPAMLPGGVPSMHHGVAPIPFVPIIHHRRPVTSNCL